jgi:serine/threonine protein kinase/Tfp pilus assembly protein PilF
MGEVYLAHDPSLDRDVALKLLPRELTADPDRRRRMVREAKAAAKVSHPNVTHVYEVGDTEGTLFIAMEYVEGRTLAEVLAAGPLPLARAIRIAIEIADALREAHDRGVIHRDIKPGNVMLTSRDQVKVLDFGLARVPMPEGGSPSGESETISRTEPGRVLGTPSYMSPEQALGQRLDARSDVFSLGLVIYEMISGRRPFNAPTLAGLLEQLLTSDPPAFPREGASPEREELWRITRKCLARAADARYPSAHDLLVDLRNLEREMSSDAEAARSRRFPGRQVIAWGGAVAVAVAIAAGLFSSRDVRRLDSIAVLPLENATGDPETEYLSDGITERLINTLAQMPDLKVRSRGSVARFKGEQVDPKAAGEALRVQALVVGRIVAREEDVSISVELVDVAEDRQLWGAQFRRDRPEELLHIEGDIARAISVKLRRRLSGEEERRITRPPTEDPVAYDLYLRGRQQWHRFREDGYLKALDYYSQALERDPRFALAYTGTAEALSVLAIDAHRRPRDAWPRARDAAERALEIDPELPEALNALAIYDLFYGWDWPRAERSFRAALELRPNYADALHYLGHYLQAVGRPQQAVERFREAIELEPLSPILIAELGFALYVTRQYDLAIAEYRQTLEMNPSFVLASWLLAQALEQQGSHEEALAEIRRALEIEPDWTHLKIELGCAYAAAGRRREALAVLEQLRRQASSDGSYLDPGYLALIPAQVGDKDAAFALLDQAIEERSSGIVWLRVEPKLDLLRSDPRFARLLERVVPEAGGAAVHGAEPIALFTFATTNQVWGISDEGTSASPNFPAVTLPGGF